MPHRYKTTVAWSGSTGAGYDLYDRTHDVSCPPVSATLRMASDPAFRGDPALLNPEQLLLAAAASCQLLAFLAVAARARVDVVSYADDASAVMPDEDEWITEITLRPTIGVRPGPSEERVRHLVEVAHHECYVARSLRSAITIEASIEWVGE